MSKHTIKQSPEWLTKAVADIKSDMAETTELHETARRRRARLGLKLIWIKAAGKADGSIPHGAFGPFLKEQFPATPPGTIGDYITEGNSILKLLGWQISEIPKFGTPPHKLISAKTDDLTSEDKSHQKKLMAVVDQQSHFRAVTQYKQVELKDDATVAKIGRRKGEGGASREQRHKHRMKLRDMDVAARKAFIVELGNACERAADDAGMIDPEIGDERAEALPKIAKLFHLLMGIEQKRGAK